MEAMDLGPVEPLTSPLRRLCAWLLEAHATQTELTVADVEAHFDLTTMAVPERQREFRATRRPVDEVVAYQELAPTVARLDVRAGADDLALRVAVTEDGKHQAVIWFAVLMPSATAAPDVTVRDAQEPDDGPELAALERRCPVVVGGVEVEYDRGDDYFAQHRLMGEHATSVAECGGRVVGIFSESPRTVLIDGAPVQTSYRFHLRVDPDLRGKRVFPALNARQLERKLLAGPPYSLAASYVAVENETMLATIPEAMRESLWSVPIERLVIDCERNAGPPLGRMAELTDAPRIAELLEASHGAEEFRTAFDETHVVDRLTRAPSLYSWHQVLLTERAVCGVWDQQLRVTRRAGTGAERSTRAAVLDWGSELGAEHELVGLLRHWCGALARTTTTHLTVFISGTSPTRRMFDALHPAVEPFFMTVNHPEPPSAAESGVHVDPIWF
jgi:hypothetical protein